MNTHHNPDKSLVCYVYVCRKPVPHSNSAVAACTIAALSSASADISAYVAQQSETSTFAQQGETTLIETITATASNPNTVNASLAVPEAGSSDAAMMVDARFDSAMVAQITSK
jgi:hypothetical protein